MFSAKAKIHADACRFCWMCRHLCPVGLKTGREVNTPRAKGLIVSMTHRNIPLDASTAEAMYECVLCGACTNDCVTGFDPLLYIREARTEAAVNGLLPPYVQETVDRTFSTGNMFGLPAKEKWDLLRDEVRELPDRADVLLYVGNTAAYRQPQIAKAAMSLLRKAGVPFTVMEQEVGTGIEAGDLIGFVEEVRALARDCAAAVNRTGAKTLVALDPYDAAAMKHEYPEWGCGIGAEVVTATAFMAGLLRSGRLDCVRTERTLTYHDGSRLGRDLDEHEPARALIAATGGEIREMFLNRRLAKGAGSGVVKQYRPDLTKLTGEGRWEDAALTGAAALVTACPQEYDILRDTVPAGYELEDLFSLLDRHVR